MRNLSVGQGITTVEFTILKYDIASETITVKFDIPSYNIPPEILPMCLPCFEVSSLGATGFMHPTKLPPNTERSVSWIRDHSNKVLHESTGDVCYLRLDDSFPFTGKYRLAPVKGEATKEFVSDKWTITPLLHHLDSLKGKTMRLSGHIYTVYTPHTDKFHRAITNNTTMQMKGALVFIQFADGLLHPIPLTYIEI